MKPKFVWILMLVLLVSFAFAQEIDVSISTIRAGISGGDEAFYNVTITNNMRFDDKFRLSFSEDLKWTVLTEPLSYRFSSFELKVEESANFLLKIRAVPSANIAFNQYIIGVTVEGLSTKQTGSSQIYVGYGPQFLTPKEYAALIIADVDAPDEVDPRKEMQIRVNIKNKNPLNISVLDIIAKSSLIDQEASIQLGPFEEKSVVFAQWFDPLQEPREDKLVVSIVKEDTILVRLEKVFEIIAYSEFEKTIKEETGFLKTIKYLEYKNNGNYKKQKNITYEISWIKSLFISSSPKAAIVKDGKMYLTWSLELEPDESVRLVVTESYLPLLYLGIAVLVMLILYFATRSPIEVSKTAMVLAKREGGIASLKVIVRVRNRTKRTIRDVWVVDSVPNIADVDRKFEIGTLEPKRIVKHEKKGTLIKWEIGDLERGEERILRYKAKPRLAILGSLNLPATVVKCYYKDKEKIVYSNRLRLNV